MIVKLIHLVPYLFYLFRIFRFDLNAPGDDLAAIHASRVVPIYKPANVGKRFLGKHPAKINGGMTGIGINLSPALSVNCANRNAKYFGGIRKNSFHGMVSNKGFWNNDRLWQRKVNFINADSSLDRL